MICLISSLNHGNTLEYIDLDLPWSPDPDAPAMEPLTVYPAPAINKVWNMSGTALDLDESWRNEYKSLTTIRLANAALDPDTIQQVIGDQAASGQLHTLDIVFPPEPLFDRPGTQSTAHLARYDWLVGSPGIRSMSLSQFRFRYVARTAEDMPLPKFLASFPKLETLEIRSEHYEEAELCSLISAIITEAKTIKVIYQRQIRGVLMDKLRKAAAKQGVKIIYGERPREWPMPVTS